VMMHIVIAERKTFNTKFIQYDRPSEAKIVCRKIAVSYVNNSLSYIKSNECLIIEEM
jgi:hypothetical protein